MAFGFGFNKAKILASAEKNVKAGKLAQAIADYQNIVRHDPSDLSALNTAGDLYVSTGEVEKATVCFRQVAQAYASDGYAVKAIAIYKKLVKHSPTAATALSQLADLYAGQRLTNEARVHYLQAAEAFLGNQELEAAAGVLRKALEYDPENGTVLQRLAEVFLKLDRNGEARDLHFRAAQAHRRRGLLPEYGLALDRALEVDPGFEPALQLRAELKLEAGDPQAAAQSLEAIATATPRIEVLRLQLRTEIQLGRGQSAESTAVKLLTDFREWDGVAAVAEWYLGRGDYELLLSACCRHADSLIAANASATAEMLGRLAGQLRDQTTALESLVDLLRRTGDTQRVVEITQWLAEAYVRENQLSQAADLYERLATLAPENPSYRETCARLRQPAAAGPPPEVAPQAEPGPAGEKPDGEPKTDEHEDISVAESYLHPPAIPSQYDAALREALKTALTEAEMSASYRLPQRALRALEALLPQAPRDVELRHAMASLYAQLGRNQEAAQCYQILAEVCAAHGHRRPAAHYSQLAARLHPASLSFHIQAAAEIDSALHADEAPAGEAELEAGEAVLDAGEAVLDAGEAVLDAEDAPASLNELLNEAQFCLNAGMAEQAASALSRAQSISAEEPGSAALRQRLQSLREPSPLSPSGADREATRPELPAASDAFPPVLPVTGDHPPRPANPAASLDLAPGKPENAIEAHFVTLVTLSGDSLPENFDLFGLAAAQAEASHERDVAPLAAALLHLEPVADCAEPTAIDATDEASPEDSEAAALELPDLACPCTAESVGLLAGIDLPDWEPDWEEDSPYSPEPPPDTAGPEAEAVSPDTDGEPTKDEAALESDFAALFAPPEPAPRDPPLLRRRR